MTMAYDPRPDWARDDARAQAPTAAQLSEEDNRGRPVVDVQYPSREVFSGALNVNHNGSRSGDRHGVIVHRQNGQTPWYSVITCSTARYRDETLIPFYGFYDSTIRIERFGPDLDA